MKLPTRHCGCANRNTFNISNVLRLVSKIREKAWLSWVQFEAPIPGSELGAEAREILQLLQVGWELAILYIIYMYKNWDLKIYVLQCTSIKHFDLKRERNTVCVIYFL